MRGKRRQPRTARARPERRRRRRRRSPTSSPTPATPAANCRANRAARRPARRRSVPAADRAGDRSLARLQGRRPDRDHLRPGAPDRPDARHQLLLHLPGLPEPSRRSRAAGSRDRPGQTERRRRPRRPAPALALRRSRHASTKAATTTTSRCCSASRNCSNWNRSATPPNCPDRLRQQRLQLRSVEQQRQLPRLRQQDAVGRPELAVFLEEPVAGDIRPEGDQVGILGVAPGGGSGERKWTV